MRAFVEYYHVFADATLSNDQAVERLNPDENLGGRRVRVNCARHLIDEGLATTALEMIVASKRVDEVTVSCARQILESQQPA